MKLLIDTSAPLERPGIEDTYSRDDHESGNPLARAIENNNLASMQSLLDAKARIDVPGTNYTCDLIRSAIEASAKHDNDDAMKFFLGSESSLIVEGRGKSLLRCAVEMNHLAIAKMLIELEASPNVIYGERNKNSLLSMAVRNNSTQMVKVLLDGKANIDLQPKGRPTPLIGAIDNRLEVVKLLVEEKASVQKVDGRRRNPLDADTGVFDFRCFDASIVKMLKETNKAKCKCQNQ